MVQSHFIVKPNLVLRLGWGFDKISKATIIFTVTTTTGTTKTTTTTTKRTKTNTG